MPELAHVAIILSPLIAMGLAVFMAITRFDQGRNARGLVWVGLAFVATAVWCGVLALYAHGPLASIVPHDLSIPPADRAAAGS